MKRISLFLFWLVLLPQLTAIAQDIGLSEDANAKAAVSRVWRARFPIPIQIKSDKHDREIVSIEIQFDNQKKSGGSGLFLIHHGEATFNEFGDVTSFENEKPHVYAITLKQFKSENKDGKNQRSYRKNRTVYKIEFDDPFCDREFFLNVSDHPVVPTRLVICDGTAAPLGGALEPKIEQLLLLEEVRANQGVEAESRFDTALYRASVLRMFDRYIPHIEIRKNTNGTGTIMVDQNSVGYSDFGSSGISTAAGFWPQNIRFVRKGIADPEGSWREVFDLVTSEGNEIQVKEQPGSIKLSFAIVLAKTSGGNHRLVVKQNGKVSHVYPLIDDGWKKHQENLNTIQSEASLNAVKRLREICGNGSPVTVGTNGKVYSLALGQGFTDEALNLVSNFDLLQRLSLSHASESFSGEGYRTISSLKNLKEFSISSARVTDQLLEILGNCPNLSEFWMRVDAEQANATDNGVANLTNATNLKKLTLCGSHITDKCVEYIGKLKHLESLDLSQTSISIRSVVRLRKMLPCCRISMSKYDGSEYRGNVTLPPNFEAIKELNKDKPKMFHQSQSDWSIRGTFTTEDYAALSQLAEFKKLDLPKSATTEDLKAIVQNDSFTSIDISNNQNADLLMVCELSSLKNLEELRIWHCHQVREDSLEFLTAMKGLKKLTILSHNIRSDAIQQLQEKMPHCKINK